MQEHHYLGYTQPVGEHLKYLIYAQGQPVAALAWSSPPRHLGACGHFIGWSASQRRAGIRLLADNRPDGRVWIIPDRDAAGERCAESLLKQITPHRFVRWLRQEENKQPTDYPESLSTQYFTK